MSTATPGSMEGTHSRGSQGDRQSMFWDYRQPGEDGSEEDKSPKGPVQLELPALTPSKPKATDGKETETAVPPAQQGRAESVPAFRLCRCWSPGTRPRAVRFQW